MIDIESRILKFKRVKPSDKSFSKYDNNKKNHETDAEDNDHIAGDVWKKGVLWLKDLPPKSFNNVRASLFNYGSNYRSESPAANYTLRSIATAAPWSSWNLSAMDFLSYLSVVLYFLTLILGPNIGRRLCPSKYGFAWQCQFVVHVHELP